MKITKKLLREIIEEEVKNTLSEKMTPIQKQFQIAVGSIQDQNTRSALLALRKMIVDLGG